MHTKDTLGAGGPETQECVPQDEDERVMKSWMYGCDEEPHDMIHYNVSVMRHSFSSNTWQQTNELDAPRRGVEALLNSFLPRNKK